MIEQALLDSIHQKIHDTVKDFIIAPTSSHEILLIRSPSGVGATYNTREASFTSNVYTMWAGPNANQVISEIANVKSVPYRSGITENNCSNFTQVEILKERGFIPQQILCDKNCKDRPACLYFKMLVQVTASADGFCMHHNMLRSNLGYTMNSKREKEVLVIDGVFLHKLISEKVFKRDDLQHFIYFINNTWLPTVTLTQDQEILKYLVSITKSLIDSLTQNLTGSQIAINLLKIPNPTNIILAAKNIQIYLKDISRDYNRLIASNPNIHIKNLLDPIFKIIEMTHEHQASDVIYPYEIKNNRLIYRSITSKLPFNVPVVIIDTYTPPELYQYIFNRKVITLDILNLFPALNKTPENLKIYQYDRGRLPKQSLKYKSVQDWLFPTIADYLKLKPKTIHAIYIPYDHDFLDVLLAHLAKHNIKNFKMCHFYDAISKGSESLERVNNMIIVGSPEPNPDILKSQIEMFYIGKQQLDMTYNKTAHTYNDKRVQVFYAIENSEHIRTIIYKMRPLTSKSQKTVLLLSKIPLIENTERLTTQDLQFRIKNADMSMSREKVILNLSKDGEVIAKRIDKVIGNYFNKHSTQDQVQMSTIIRNVKSKNEFKTYDDSVITDIIKLICIVDGQSIRK